MNNDKQPSQKVTGDMMFVIIFAVLGCLVTVFGAMTGNYWIVGAGVLIMPIAFQAQKLFKKKH